MGVYVHDNNWASRRGIVLVILVLFHLMLFWALKSGFAQKVIDSLAPPIVADIINDKKEEEAPPPPPPPKMEIPPVEVPPPVVDITLPVEVTTTAISNVTDKPVPPPPPAPPPAPTILPVLAGTPPNPSDYYPPTSVRLEEQGRVVVQICVGVDSKVKDVSVTTSSGIPRLDEAGVKMGRAYRFKKPAIQNGVAVEKCFAAPMKFSLEK
jgi:periplasmic protein TonB